MYTYTSNIPKFRRQLSGTPIIYLILGTCKELVEDNSDGYLGDICCDTKEVCWKDNYPCDEPEDYSEMTCDDYYKNRKWSDMCPSTCGIGKYNQEQKFTNFCVFLIIRVCRYICSLYFLLTECKDSSTECRSASFDPRFPDQCNTNDALKQMCKMSCGLCGIQSLIYET